MAEKKEVVKHKAVLPDSKSWTDPVKISCFGKFPKLTRDMKKHI